MGYPNLSLSRVASVSVDCAGWYWLTGDGDALYGCTSPKGRAPILVHCIRGHQHEEIGDAPDVRYSLSAGSYVSRPTVLDGINVEGTEMLEQIRTFLNDLRNSLVDLI